MLIGQKNPGGQFPLRHNEVGRERAAVRLGSGWQHRAPFLLPLEPSSDSQQALTPPPAQSHLCGNLAVPCKEIDRRT